MKITGYLQVKPDASFEGTVWQHYQLPGAILPILHSNHTEGVLVYVAKMNANVRIAPVHILNQFACRQVRDVLVPDGLTEFEITKYMEKLNQHQINYTEAIAEQIIADSLAAGVFTDTCLFNEIQVEK